MSSLRWALRGLLRSPDLSLAATLCIALGAAATTSVATLANAVLVRPVPFPDADRLLRVWLEEPGVPRVSLSIPESREIHGLAAFDKVLATARVRAVTVLADGAQRLRGESVDRGYFETLGLRAAAGRLLTSDDHRPDALWAADAVTSLLYEVPPFDALSFTIALSLLMAVALVAALLPARRAASVDPMVALRAE